MNKTEIGSASLINASNEDFLRTSADRVALSLSDPPWGAGDQNVHSDFFYPDPMSEMEGHVQRLIDYGKRCADTQAIFCDKRALHLWHRSLLRYIPEDRIQHVILESAIGNYSRKSWPQKHYYMIIGHYSTPAYFDFSRLPETDRRAPKEGYDGTRRKTNSVIQATISCTARERVKGFTAQKPVWLLRSVIEVLSPPGAIVSDPYMGTGSTGVAALETGRGFVGYEMNPKTFQVACHRVGEAHKVVSLLRVGPTIL